jgi:hypothetical protein
MRRRFAAGLALATALAGCGGDEGERVSPAVQRALPTHQYGLVGDVCPHELGMPRAQAERVARRGRRQLAALLDAPRRDPDAVGRTPVTVTNGRTEVVDEDLTVRELLETHLESAELSDAHGPAAACERDVVARLRAARDG